MEISYRREMKHNYMIVESETVSVDSYEVNMMKSNCIEGLLRFHTKRTDNRQFYYYEITSRQPLSRLLETHCLTSEELRSLIFGFSRILTDMEQYLLSDSQILLEPDYIYMDLGNTRPWLCLIPGRNEEFAAGLSKLLQYLLGKIDHGDKACVVLAYGLYQESLKDNYGIDDLIRLAATGGEHNGNVSDPGHQEMTAKLKSPPVVNYAALPIPECNKDNRYSPDEDDEKVRTAGHNCIRNKWFIRFFKMAIIAAVTSVGGAASLFALGGFWMLQKYGLLLAVLEAAGLIVYVIKSKHTDTVTESYGMRWESGLDEIRDESFNGYEYAEDINAGQCWNPDRADTGYQQRCNDQSGVNQKTVTNDQSKVIYPSRATCQSRATYQSRDNHPADLSRQPASYGQFRQSTLEVTSDECQTVLLTSEGEEDVQRYFRSIDKTIDDIVIAYVPFLIGKQPGMADCVLSKEIVSRLHVKIDCQDEIYYITDLNSTNGTKLNGRLLESNETAELAKGDEVYIANIGFVFT